MKPCLKCRNITGYVTVFYDNKPEESVRECKKIGKIVWSETTALDNTHPHFYNNFIHPDCPIYKIDMETGV